MSKKERVNPSSSIEEVNSALEFKEHPPSKGLGIVLWAITFFFWASAVFVLLSLFRGTISIPIDFLGVFLSPMVLSMILVLVIVSFVGGFLLLKLIHKAAKEVTLAVFSGIPLFLIIGGVIGYILIRSLFLLIFIGIGVVGLILFFIFKDKLEIVGRTLELSAESIVTEPGQLLATFLAAFFGFLTFVGWGLTMTMIWVWVAPIIDTRILGVIEAVLFFLGIWTMMFQKYFWDAVIVGITHNWYRSPNVDVASFNQGMDRALKTMGGVASFAFVMSIFRALIAAARRRGGIAASIVATILRIGEAVIKFIGFFALPAIVIRKTGFKKGFMDSVEKLQDFFVEVLATSFGFSLVLGVFGLIVSIFYGGIGFFIGTYFFYPMITTNLSSFIVGIVSAVGFWIVGLFPTFLIFSTLTTTFKTILYEFGIDLEFADKGQSLPKRLPSDIKAQFTEKIEEQGKALPASF